MPQDRSAMAGHGDGAAGGGSNSGSDSGMPGQMMIQQATNVGTGTSGSAALSNPPTTGDLLVALMSCGVPSRASKAEASRLDAGRPAQTARSQYGFVEDPATMVTATCTGNSPYALDVTEWWDAQMIDAQTSGLGTNSRIMVSPHGQPTGDLVVLVALVVGTGSASPAPEEISPSASTIAPR